MQLQLAPNVGQSDPLYIPKSNVGPPCIYSIPYKFEDRHATNHFSIDADEICFLKDGPLIKHKVKYQYLFPLQQFVM